MFDKNDINEFDRMMKSVLDEGIEASSFVEFITDDSL